ncbi:MAG: hypothetical protein IJU90_01770 [Bacteroidales bacterium]|nr:hypothetical protein [Bacteroidales bacterium]
MKIRFFLLLLTLCLVAGLLYAQAPQSINSQAVLRDAAGRLIANQPVGVRITIAQGSPTGTAAYVETHAVTTNDNGLYTITIGAGTPATGTFSDIDWGNGPYFITTDIDPAGGSNYTITTNQQFLSVPYALFADTAARVAQATAASNATHANTSDNATHATYADRADYADTALYYRERQVLTLGNDTIYLTGGSYVVLPPSSNANINNRYIDSVVRTNNTTVVNHYVDSVIRANNSTVVNNYVDSVIRANNSTVVNNYVDSVIRNNNTTVVNNYVDSVVRNNNSTMVSHYVDSVINARNNTMSRDTITATIRDSVMAILRDSACYASCSSIDSLRRRNDSAYRAFDSIVNVQNIALHRYDSVINIQRRDIRRYDSIIRTFDSVVATYDSIINSYDSVVVSLVDSITHRGSSLPSSPDSCNGRNTTGIDTQVATDSYTWIDLNTYTFSTTTPRYVLRGVNAVGCDSIVILNLTINPSGVVVTEGALPGEFSVSAIKKVKFSQGNLQYQASTQTWRFAEHQYDFIGATLGNTTHMPERSTQSDWIDLFGWATSGYHYSPDYYNFYYQPYDIYNSTGVDGTYNPTGYGPSTNQTRISLVNDKKNYDWGVRNAISNGGNVAGAWRTLTLDEWRYLVQTRTTTGEIRGTSNARFLKAKVCGVAGLILFPDTFTYPDGIPIPFNTNKTDANYTDEFDLDLWTRIEALGCVFLPSAGRRSGTAVIYAGSGGNYWSSTFCDSSRAYSLNFGDSGMDPRDPAIRYSGRSVRLVQDL